MPDDSSLDQALDDVQVVDLETLDEGVLPWTYSDGYAVMDRNGVRGLFAEEGDALFFRLALINAKLNPVGV